MRVVPRLNVGYIICEGVYLGHTASCEGCIYVWLQILDISCCRLLGKGYLYNMLANSIEVKHERNSALGELDIAQAASEPLFKCYLALFMILLHYAY